ncbi:MAG: hypothetical protein NZM26_04420 [Patescibacteria group bacterium]|nr:hypothetical protein [Patescibacteria group bacterium]
MNLLVQNNPLGNIPAPVGVVQFDGGNITGISIFITVLVRLIIIGAGIYGLINLALAGYSFISAGGDSKQIADAWAKIWQTILGIAVSAGSFVIAALIGLIFFGDATAILNPIITTPR